MKLCIYLNKLKIKLERIIVKGEVGLIRRRNEENPLKNVNYIKLREEVDKKYKQILQIYKIILINLPIIILINKLLI